MHKINHLWFLQALVAVYLLLPLLAPAFSENGKGMRFFFCCVMALTFGYDLVVMGLDVLERLLRVELVRGTLDIVDPFNPFTGVFGYSLGYFLLGGYLQKYREKLAQKRFAPLAAAVFLLSMALLTVYCYFVGKGRGERYVPSTFEYDSFFTMCATASLFVLALRYRRRGIAGGLVAAVSRNTLATFFLHRQVAEALLLLFPALLATGGLLLNLLFTALVVGLCTGLGELFRRIPVVNGLFRI